MELEKGHWKLRCMECGVRTRYGMWGFYSDNPPYSREGNVWVPLCKQCHKAMDSVITYYFDEDGYEFFYWLEGESMADMLEEYVNSYDVIPCDLPWCCWRILIRNNKWKSIREAFGNIPIRMRRWLKRITTK